MKNKWYIIEAKLSDESTVYDVTNVSETGSGQATIFACKDEKSAIKFLKAIEEYTLEEVDFD